MGVSCPSVLLFVFEPLVASQCVPRTIQFKPGFAFRSVERLVLFPAGLGA